MSLEQLSDEQIRTMTLKEKDLWWKENIWNKDMPQLTIKSAFTGIFLGGVLSLTNLYVGIKTGWTLGVGITSVVLSFGIYKTLAKIGLGKEMTILENNCMQSIATSAGYTTAPLVSSMAAYMLITGQVIPMYQIIIWMALLSLMGVLYAFPLKKRFINDEQLPFPEGRAAAVVMDSLHHGEGKEGMFQAKLMTISGIFAATIEFLRSEKILEFLHVKFLALPAYWDEWVYRFVTPKILGTPLKDLTIRFDSSIVMVGAGGLMGITTGLSLLLGGVINYFFLAPYMIQQGIIEGSGFKNITMWALWGGVAVMTTSSLYSFLSKPQLIISSFKGMFSKKGRKTKEEDVLAEIELPLSVFFIGMTILSPIMIYCAHKFFNVHPWMAFIAIPLVFVFTIIAVNSTGLTSITPIGAMGKLTQLTFGILEPKNITTNIMTASITGEVASNTANLLMDIKPGYMLGAKPRVQAIGHVIGIFAGLAVVVPVFYMIMNGNVNLLTSEKLPMPSAQVWKAVAEVFTKGFDFIHPTARIAVIIGGILGLVIEILRIRTQGKFWLSGVGLGLAFVLPFSDVWTMSLGSILVWLARRKFTLKESKAYKIFVKNQESLCAGIIAGGALVGIAIILAETWLSNS